MRERIERGEELEKKGNEWMHVGGTDKARTKTSLTSITGLNRVNMESTIWWDRRTHARPVQDYSGRPEGIVPPFFCITT